MLTMDAGVALNVVLRVDLIVIYAGLRLVLFFQNHCFLIHLGALVKLRTVL